MPDTSTANRAADAGQAPLLEWTVHLAPLTPGKTLRALLLIMAAAVGVGAIWGSVLPGAVAFALLVLGTSEYFLPLRFRLTADGAIARGLTSCRRMRWASVRRVISDDGGIKISPLARGSRLEPFRGIYLRFPREEPRTRERVLQIVLSRAGALQT